MEAKFILWKETLLDRQRIFFLFVDWAYWKFFFLWKKCFVSQLFFIAFKRTLLIVLLQVKRMKVKATMIQISFEQKIRGKSKKLQAPKPESVDACFEMKPFSWLKAMLQKGFSNSFLCTSDRWSLFVPKSVAFEERKKLYSCFTTGNCFFKQPSHLRPIFVNLSTEKHL